MPGRPRWRSAGGAPPELLDGAIADAIGWLRAQRGPLEAAAAFTQAVSEAVGRPLTAGQARHLVTPARRGRRRPRDASPARAASSATRSAACTPATDRSADRQDCASNGRVLRAIVTGTEAPLTQAQVKAGNGAIPDEPARGRREAWSRARDALLEAFGPDRRADLSAELDDYAEADDLIEALRQDTGGQEEWHAYRGPALRWQRTASTSPSTSACPNGYRRGRCRDDRTGAAARNGRKITSGRSGPVGGRATDRDALVGEYRKLDRALIENATGNIIRACNARRPRSDIGESAIIPREAGKKRSTCRCGRCSSGPATSPRRSSRAS